MSRKLWCIVLAVLVLAGGCGWRQQNDAKAESQSAAGSTADEPLPVLPASVAGSFYPPEPDKIRDSISRYVSHADVPEIHGEVIAAIVPHAGYIYSGPVAAYAYKAIAAQAEKLKAESGSMLDAVIVLAFSHRSRYPGVFVYYKGAVETPLGIKAVNEKIAREFMDSDPRISFSQQVFSGEHSAEVQVPFIQVMLPDVSIVPVIMGSQSRADIEAVSKGLETIARENRIMVVATTDLSHYNPYEKAKSLDSETVRLLLEGDPRRMAEYVTEYYDRMCGPGPVLAVMSYAQAQGATPVLLKYANSGDTAGNKKAVVGYVALAFVKQEKREPKARDSEQPTTSVDEPDALHEYLRDEEKEALLGIARRSLELFVRDGEVLTIDPPASETLKRDGAAFVTLRKEGRLRGCMGRMQATSPLYKTVIRMAIAAASEDPRFRPVRPDELGDIHIEISVNTPLRPVSGPDEIVLGKHGVVVTKGFRQGVFLPHVATETGWTKEEFLRNLCAHKAGLPPDEYTKDARLYVFTSVTFEEEL